MLWCALRALTADAWATPLERVEFEGAFNGSFRAGSFGATASRASGEARWRGSFPAVIGLHGCAGMHEATKQRLADELVARAMSSLLVDSYATRGIDHACTSAAFATFLTRRPDAYGALVFLSRQTFVDPQRVAAVGFLGRRLGDPLGGGAHSFEPFVTPGNVRFRAAAASISSSERPCTSGQYHAHLHRAIDDWTPAADWLRIKSPAGARRAAVELVVYPARTMDSITGTPARHDHVWSLAGIHGEAADDASHRLYEFLDRHLD